MSLKQRGMMAALFAMASMGSNMRMPKEDKPELSKRERELKEMEETKRIRANQGLKEFVIDGYAVMALNEKNALRKVNKLKEAQKG